MNAGLLTELVKFLRPDTEKDDYGSTNVEYKLAFRTRARVKYNSGNREVINNEIYNAYNYIFTIRGYHLIDEKMIIEWKCKRYRILSIDNTLKTEITITTELIND